MPILQEQQPEQWRQGSGEMPEASGNSASSSSTEVSVRSSSGGGLQTAAVTAGSRALGAPHAQQPGSLQSAPASDEMDFEATAASQQQHASSIGLPFSANAFEHAFTEAFSKVDEEFGKKQDQSQVGTTAVVALVGDRQLYIGNCGAWSCCHPTVSSMSSFGDLLASVEPHLGPAAPCASLLTAACRLHQCILSLRHLLFACCPGDSRAVLCRSGMAIPLTEDHKAARDDETVRLTAAWLSIAVSTLTVWLWAPCWKILQRCDSLPVHLLPVHFQARVEAAGGEVMWWNGERVMGVLAVSRSIGDHYLRPFVIAQPEVRWPLSPWVVRCKSLQHETHLVGHRNWTPVML
jgi:Protein phosphatase 2C